LGNQTIRKYRVLVGNANGKGEDMNIQARQPSDYAPTTAEPIRLASATMNAVDRIGEATAEEIEKTANEVMRGATEVAENLRALATAIRQHGKIANEHVAGFCDKATAVFVGVRDLQQRLEVRQYESETKEPDDAAPPPTIVREGPN
jgi:hypothetical protein